jgi:hypothetical protein
MTVTKGDVVTAVVYFFPAQNAEVMDRTIRAYWRYVSLFRPAGDLSGWREFIERWEGR